MSGRVCAYRGCGYRLMFDYHWRQMTRLERWEHRQQGVNEHAGRGLCRRCWDREREHGNLENYSRLSMSREEVLAEWEHLDLNRELSRKRRIEIAAPRMGMTPAALEKALLRAAKEAS